MLNIGINGLGRIGKCIFLQLINDESVSIKAININQLSIYDLEKYINYDSIHKKNQYKVLILENNYVSIGIHKIKIFQTKNHDELTWKNENVNYLLECSGAYLTSDKAKLHDVDYLIMSAPPKDILNTPVYCFGVNHNNYNGEKIISNASCTTNCITPFLKYLNNYDISSGSFITVHSATSSQTIVDNANGTKRTNRSIFNNIIPHTTGASKCIDILIPELKNKVKGTSVRVPTSNVSMIDLNVEFKNKVSKELILSNISEINSEVIEINKDNAVSSDFIGNKKPSILDYNSTIQISDKIIKFTLWYDNEWSYASQMILMTKHMDQYNNKTKLNNPHHICFKNKTVLVRCDYNCPVDENNQIQDFFRIESSLPTLKKILFDKPKHLIIMTHFGRPQQVDQKYSTKIFLEHLEKYLNCSIHFLKDGLNTKKNHLHSSGVYLMENVRFHEFETKYNSNIQVLEPDVYCNEAFSCSHRKHTSIIGINANEKCYGYCFIKEIEALNTIIQSRNLKITAIIGGSKIDDKIRMMENLSKKVDFIFITGNNVNAYDEKKDFLDSISNNKAKIILAEDGIGNTDPSKDPIYIRNFNKKNKSIKIFDIGLKALNTLYNCINQSDLIFWNGTLGIVENKNYNSGSISLLNILNKSGAKVIVGGGDTASFVNKYDNNFFHVSTGGGASIEYLGNSTLHGII